MKSCISIFTCLITRAIHLEVNSMCISAFIFGFSSFVDKYSIPSVVYSDDAVLCTVRWNN